MRSVKTLLMQNPTFNEDSRQVFDRVDKHLFKQITLHPNRPLRVLSDELIPWIRPTNLPPFGQLKYDKIRAPLTLIFQIKTIDGYVKPPYGLRTSRDFAPPWSPLHKRVYKEFWWRHIGQSKSYQEAKRETGKYLDKIYSMIYRYNMPIVAIKVFLVDLHADQAVGPKILNWRIFSTHTFEGWKVDAMNLKSWGIKADKFNFEVMKTGKINGVDYWEYKTSDKNPIELETNLDVDEVIDSSVSDILSELPTKMKGKNSTLNIIMIKRIMFVTRSSTFKGRIKRLLLNEFLKDDKLREKSRTRNGEKLLLAKTTELIKDELSVRGLWEF